MKKAAIPENELQRLSALLNYKVLDTAPELEYDDITLLASQICQTPIALVSLIDSDRQWFKSRQGLDAPETPRDVSFCGHAIHGKDVFEIPDAFQDPRFADNPLVTGAPVVRFYAGAPLVTPEGFAVGTLCVIDHQPKKLEANQIKALQCLARSVVAHLELRKLNRKLKTSLDEIQSFTIQFQKQQGMIVNAAKMASLGEIASGIAHEVNNPLAIIGGKVHTMKSKIKKIPDAAKAILSDLDSIEKTVERIAVIVRGLRTFASETTNQSFDTHDIEKIVQDVVSIMGQKIADAGIEFKVSVPPKLSAYCRSNEVSQALMNLTGNAFDAVFAQAIRIIEVSADSQGDRTIIRVRDNGPGIPQDVRDKIMLPFFTTKEVGKGTGLGLSTAKGLIEAQHGRLYLDESETMTCFVVELPAKAPSTIQRSA
jgi:signal transduction histidine kinase